MSTFERELEELLNKYCEENNSNTPDFILASFVSRCLDLWNEHTNKRDIWYGVHLEPGNVYFGE